MNFFKKTIKSLFIFLAIFGLAFSNLPYVALTGVLKSYISSRNIVDKIWVASSDSNVVDKFVPFENVIRNLKIKDALAVANGDGKIFYSISANTTPRTRDYISSTNTFNTAVSTVVGATALQVVTKASPTKDEMIAGYVNSAGTLQVMCWNGTSWTNEWSVAAGGTGTTRRFDIAYETSSGDAMVLYSTNAGTTNELAYRTKLGSAACGSANWSAGTNLDPVRTTGVVHWVKLAHDRRAAQNLITAIWADANADLSAMVWSGSAWGNEPTTALETALEIVTAGQDVESFDVEYESLSGDVMIVRGSGGTATTNGAFYSVCTGGTSACTWGARTAMPTVADDATHIDIAGDPNTDKILYGAIGNAGSDLTYGVWSGTAWTNAAGDAATAAPLAGTKFVSVGWLNNGATNRGVLVYYDSAATNIGWYTVSGTTWTTQTDAAVTPVFGVQKNYDIRMDPINKDRLMFTVNDAVSDISAKRLIMDAAGAFTWSNSTGGAPIEANTGSATYKSSDFEYARFVTTVATLTIGVTAGSKLTTVTSGTVSQYANDPACASAAACAAFTILPSTSETLTSIKVTETGTTNGTTNLTNVALFYDTDGNYSNGVTGQFGTTVASLTTDTATVSGSLAMTGATTYYFYVRYDLINGANDPVGGETVNWQIAGNADVVSGGGSTKSGAPVSLAGTTTVKPDATAVTYQVNTDGARSGYSATVTGYGFGVAPIGSRGSCSGAVNTGCVQFIIGGTATVATGDVSAWANRSLSFTVNSALASNGGASAIQVSSGAQTDATPLTFYIYPSITGIIDDFGGAGTAREYDVSDNSADNTTADLKDGEIQINGDHFGSAGAVTLLGQTGTQAVVGTRCSSSAYLSTCIVVQVPISISDGAGGIGDYVGNVVVTRSSDSKTDTLAGFRVLPRITSNTATTEISGNKIKILGNHFCQSGTCPVSPNRSTASDNVFFGTTQALESDFVNSGTAPCSGNVQAWTSTEICVKVPAGLITGSQPTKVTSNTSYLSNTMAFTVPSTIPNDPVLTVPKQYKSDGTTVITHMTKTNETTVVLKADISGSIAIDMALQVEVDATGAGFDGAGIIQGTVGGGGACTACTSLANARVTITGLSDGDKQWRARVVNTGNGTEFSNWAYYENPSTAEVDFTVDTIAPTITFTPTDTCAGGQSNLGTNGVKIDWSLNESATGQLEYGTDANLTGSTLFPATPATSNTSHAITLSNLNSGTLYYYKVKSQDTAGNLGSRPTANPYCSFTTGSNLSPAKTIRFHIAGDVSAVTGGTLKQYQFYATTTEANIAKKSAFIVLTGIYDTTNVAPSNSQINVQYEAEAAGSYALPGAPSGTYRGLFRIVRSVGTVNTASVSTFSVTPDANTTLYINSAELVMTYSYTP